MILAYIGRPTGWDFPLFLHVAGAMVLFGAVLAAAVLAFAGGRGESRLLARSTFLALVTTAIPAWIVLRGGAQWVSSKEHDPKGSWIDIGSGVSDGGAILLLVMTGLAYRWSRNGGTRAPRWIGGLSVLYLAALALAWLAMSAKWGSGSV